MVTFTDAYTVDTTASFSGPGTYVSRLTADDGDLAPSDEVTIVVIGTGAEVATEVRVVASSDDAEEGADSRVHLAGDDLELVSDQDDQTLGVRFNEVGILLLIPQTG